MVVDLFAGPGGLDAAAHWLQLPSIGIEFDESAVKTREAAGLSSILADVRDWAATDFDDSVNVLTGGPPCQTYTVAGKGHGRRALAHVIELVERLGAGHLDDVLGELATHSDPRTGLVLQPLIWALSAINDERPYEAIMLEQVPAVEPVWRAVAAVLEAHGYGTDVGVLRTEEYGVPQTRRRAILTARLGVAPEDVWLPAPTHQRYTGAAEAAQDSLPKWRSMADALDTSAPFTVVSNYSLGGDATKRCKRRHDRPAFTVTGKASRNRLKFDSGREERLSMQDAGRLQTFPEDFPWRGRDISQQIGNAIPPRLGAHLLAHLLGLEIGLDEEFFARKAAGWSRPTDEVAAQVRETIVRDVNAQSSTLLVGPPLGAVREDAPIAV
ncbi:DNA cytosine methyltransferase [Gordonia sp. X0973]|nr:DNA cytosine methyltransferase [Gordonia sp. X0973]